MKRCTLRYCVSLINPQESLHLISLLRFSYLIIKSELSECLEKVEQLLARNWLVCHVLNLKEIKGILVLICLLFEYNFGFIYS